MNDPLVVFDGPDDLEKLCSVAVRAAVDAHPALDFTDWEVGVTITDDAAIQALNAEHRGRDKPTNVLSFPLDCPTAGQDGNHDGTRGGLLGDIVLSWNTIRREAAREGKTERDHLTHLVIHGMLHLLRYDHEIASDAVEMETLEIQILAGLGIANPYAESHMPIEPPAPGDTSGP